MGHKKRPGTGVLRTEIRSTLKSIGPASKAQLLAALRGRRDNKAAVSVRRLSSGLSRLISEGRVIKQGDRARARFRVASK